MSTRLTVFTATLVQDSALSVSGVDRESGADQPFALVDGVPMLLGRGLKGAAVAMARRFFDPLPRSVSESPQRNSAFRRSAWEFCDARPNQAVAMQLRAGVGIRHKTGTRASGVLHDREVVPAGTRWPLVFRVDASHAGTEFAEAEGILGYVLKRHWMEGRCWLGGDVARGLGWCHIEDLRAYRFDEHAYECWVRSGRSAPPQPEPDIPEVMPTRGWCFRTLDINIAFGEYQPEANESPWGLDMLAIGPHDATRSVQVTGDGAWARPSWAEQSTKTPPELLTDRAILMHGSRPLLPGSSVRGPLRHIFSRLMRMNGQDVQDPHLVQGKVSCEDPGGKLFGNVALSSRVLIRDAVAEAGWAAARLHMHAEDEFSAGSFGTAKRDAVRLLRGLFLVRIVVEGPEAAVVDPLVAEVDRLVALGGLGHLPLGGHKTRGAGWGRWQPRQWVVHDVKKAKSWTQPKEEQAPEARSARAAGKEVGSAWAKWRGGAQETVWVVVTTGSFQNSSTTLSKVAAEAKTRFGERHALVAWWCDPAIDLSLSKPPATFGRTWPESENFRVEEVAFFAKRAVWRAARTVVGVQWVFFEEVTGGSPEAQRATVMRTPARLHGSARFAAADTGRGPVLLREWHAEDGMLSFTIEEVRS